LADDFCDGFFDGVGANGAITQWGKIYFSHFCYLQWKFSWSRIDGGTPTATNYWKPNNTDCTGWTSSSNGVNGYRGGPNVLSSYFLENQFGTCDQQGYLLCVEQ